MILTIVFILIAIQGGAIFYLYRLVTKLQKRASILEAAVTLAGRNLGKRLEESGSWVRLNGSGSWADIPDYEFE